MDSEIFSFFVSDVGPICIPHVFVSGLRSVLVAVGFQCVGGDESGILCIDDVGGGPSDIVYYALYRIHKERTAERGTEKDPPPTDALRAILFQSDRHVPRRVQGALSGSDKRPCSVFRR